MSLVIRLSKVGRKGERKFRIVVKEKRSKRDGDAIDYLGFYEKRGKEVVSEIDKKKLSYWQEKGAKLSVGMTRILGQK